MGCSKNISERKAIEASTYIINLERSQINKLMTQETRKRRATES